MAATEYTVRLEEFEGPLDLLLFLVRRNEVDILDLPIAQLTGQYIEYLQQIDRIDIDLAGEFLVMATMLMEIKSRLLAPAPKADDVASSPDEETGLDADDPRYELVKQLLAYKRYRDAAQQLDERREQWSRRAAVVRRHVNQQAIVEDEEATQEFDLEDTSVWDLFAVFQRIIEAIDFQRVGDHNVEYDDTPIVLHETDLLDQISRAHDRRLSLRSACAGRKRGEIIGLFLATLELVRQRKVTVEQDAVADDIVLVHRSAEDESGEAQAPPQDRNDQSPPPMSATPSSTGTASAG